jgi:hypothetical protein
VGPDNQLVDSPDRPVNPAIEMELNGPDGAERRLAFARFPDFPSMHGGERRRDLKVSFVAPTPSALTIEPVEPARKTRVPAVLLRVNADDGTQQMWLQKYQPGGVSIRGEPYDLVFRDKQLSLGFKITLNDFRIGYYPGTMRPRSFESHITILDPATGRAQSRVVSMNNPTSHGGYTFYQSDYRQNEARAISFLSVSRDPGQPIVFTGYIAMMIGMVVVLITRIADQRRAAGKSAHGAELIPERIHDEAQMEQSQGAKEQAGDTSADRMTDSSNQPVTAPRH